MSALNSFTQLRRGGSVRWASLRATGAWLLMAFGLSMLLAACGGGDGATPAGGSEARLSKAAITETRQSVDMRILLLSAQGNPDLIDAPKALLEKLGVPFDVLITSTNPTATAAALNALSDGNGNGKYQGFLLETDTLDIGGVSTLAAGQWAQLAQYQINFGVRQVVMYQNPYDPFSFGQTPVGGVSIAETPMKATLTDAGKQVFDYLNLTQPVDFIQTYWFQSTPATLNAGEKLDVLLENSGYIVASVFTEADGRQTLGLNLASNPNLNHVWLLGPGMVNWLTKGVYMGERSSYLIAQPDDVLIPDEIWNINTNTTGPADYRITADDLNRLVAWQNGLRSNPNQAAIRLEMPFNGAGLGGEIRPESYRYPANDALTAAVKQSIVRKDFRWINHAYSHANMDSPTTVATILSELNENHRVAGLLGLTEDVDYFKDSFINPEISGLENDNFYTAASTYGLRNIVMDTSKCYPTFRPEAVFTPPRLPSCAPIPTFGGYVDSRAPELLIMPRYPTNLYYNVSTPAEWVDEYNYYYGPAGVLPVEQRFPTDRTYEEILDFESNVWLSYLLRYDPYPLMFHQANLRAYQSDNTDLTAAERNRSLLSDLIDMTISKYNARLNLPIKSPSLHELGQVIQQRMAYNAAIAAGVKGRIVFGATTDVIAGIEIVNPTSNPVSLPLTGYGPESDIYVGQASASLTVPPQGTYTVNLDLTTSLADVTTQITLPTSAPAGSVVRGTVVFTNSAIGLSAITATKVTGSVTFSNGAPAQIFNIGDLAPGASSVPQAITVTLPASGSLTATSNVATEAEESNALNNSASATTNALQADLTVSLALPPSAVAGSMVSGTLTVNNSGALAASTVSAIVTVQGGQTLTVDLGAIDPGSAVTQAIDFTAPSGAGTISVGVTVSTVSPESDTLNNSNSALMNVETETVVSTGGGGGCTTNPDAAFDPLLLLLLLGGGLATVRRQRQTRH